MSGYFNMGSCIRSIVLWVLLLWAGAAHAQTTVIYQDDFEGTVSGWTDNSTDYDPDVTNFLGRFAAGQTTTSRTFTVPANSAEMLIAFDLYRFDSWDDFAAYGFDRFEVEINGTEIFSLPFPMPQAARSGTTGNVDWEHTPSTGMVELAFASGQYWFDQIHRFEITVNNPGTTVTLTLRADLSQNENDESAGYDNMLVTAGPATNDIVAVAETFSPINGTNGGVTPSVLSSDTINCVILNPSDVTITSTTSSDPNVTLDLITGLITVTAGTAAGSYTVDYEICENINTTNCSSVTETVTVFVPGGSNCPAGTNAIPGTYHVVSASGGQNPNRTIGVPLAEGTTETGGNSAVTYYGAITMDLTGDSDILVPAGEVIEIVLSSAWGTSARAEILMSVDDVTYTSLGTTGNGGSVYGAWSSNILRYDDFTVPAGGARYLQVLQESSGVRADGVIYSTQCQESSDPTNLSASKSVAIHGPLGQGLYAVPGNDVIYTISIENTGTGDVDSGSLVLIDNMPSEVVFYNDDIDDAGPETNPVAFQDSGGGLIYTYSTDVSFSDSATEPSSYADCNYTPTIIGYDPNVSYICINPKGVMVGSSTWSVSFRARIE